MKRNICPECKNPAHCCHIKTKVERKHQKAGVDGHNEAFFDRTSCADCGAWLGDELVS
jgi:hypothetical protein